MTKDIAWTTTAAAGVDNQLWWSTDLIYETDILYIPQNIQRGNLTFYIFARQTDNAPWISDSFELRVKECDTRDGVLVWVQDKLSNEVSSLEVTYKYINNHATLEDFIFIDYFDWM